MIPRPMLCAPVSGFSAYIIATILDQELPRRLVEFQDRVDAGRLHPQHLLDLRLTHAAIRAARTEWVDWHRAASVDGSVAEVVPISAETHSGSVREINTDRASTILGVTPARVRQLLRAGVLPGRQEGRTWLVPASAVHAYRGDRRWEMETAA